MTGANGKPLLRSQISDAHPARVLSKDNVLDAKDKDNTGAPKYQANQHRWTEQWTKEDLVDISSIIQGNGDAITCTASSKPNHKDNTPTTRPQ